MVGQQEQAAGSAMCWQVSAFDRLSGPTLYAILAARIDVFVVEQRCAYQDLDGLDDQALHLWATDADGRLAAYARILPPGLRFPEVSIGRVLTVPRYRGMGLGRELMAQAIALAQRHFPASALRISAQQYLERFYAGLGFLFVRGPYAEDGIPHIEMLRSAR